MIGGKAHGMKPSQFNARQLQRGTRVEMEHTRSKRLAREIAMDHLVEDPSYYRKLAKFHLDGYDQNGRPCKSMVKLVVAIILIPILPP